MLHHHGSQFLAVLVFEIHDERVLQADEFVIRLENMHVLSSPGKVRLGWLVALGKSHGLHEIEADPVAAGRRQLCLEKSDELRSTDVVPLVVPPRGCILPVSKNGQAKTWPRTTFFSGSAASVTTSGHSKVRTMRHFFIGIVFLMTAELQAGRQIREGDTTPA